MCVLAEAVQDKLSVLFGSHPARSRKLFLRFQRDSDGLATIDAVTQGLNKAGVAVTANEVQSLITPGLVRFWGFVYCD